MNAKLAASIPFQPVDYTAKGYHFDAAIAPEKVVEAAALLDAAGFALDTITGVDWMAEGQMEVVYDFFRFDRAFLGTTRKLRPFRAFIPAPIGTSARPMISLESTSWDTRT
jgi:hypothetical protein